MYHGFSGALCISGHMSHFFLSRCFLGNVNRKDFFCKPATTLHGFFSCEFLFAIESQVLISHTCFHFMIPHLLRGFDHAGLGMVHLAILRDRSMLLSDRIWCLHEALLLEGGRILYENSSKF